MQRWHYVELDERARFVRPNSGASCDAFGNRCALRSRNGGRIDSVTRRSTNRAPRFGRSHRKSLRLYLIVFRFCNTGYVRRRESLAVDAAEPCEDLLALLARVLFAFALDFEARSELSLALAVDVLRVVSDDGVRQRGLPHLSGVSKEAIAMAIGFLTKRGLVSEDVASESSGKRIHLSANGVRAFKKSAADIRTVEGAWSAGTGAHRVAPAGGARRRGRATRPERRLVVGARPRAASHRLALAAAVCSANRDAAVRIECGVAALSDGAASRRLARRQLKRRELRTLPACRSATLSLSPLVPVESAT